MIDKASILEALSTVRDPELDQSLTELGFVAGVAIEEDCVSVRLWLPTYWCAPNFAYLMAADTKSAVSALEGVGEVKVALVDHFASGEISEGLALGRDFDQTFPDDATGGGLDDLRDLFRRKAFIARQEGLCRSLRASGVEERELAGLVIGDLPSSPEKDLYLERRAELGIDTSGSAPFLVTADGTPVPDAAVREHLRFARMVSLSIEGNAGLCRSLLEARYGAQRTREAAK